MQAKCQVFSLVLSDSDRECHRSLRKTIEEQLGIDMNNADHVYKVFADPSESDSDSMSESEEPSENRYL